MYKRAPGVHTQRLQVSPGRRARRRGRPPFIRSPSPPPRPCSAILYLNEDFEGGDFIFTELDAKTVTVHFRLFVSNGDERQAEPLVNVAFSICLRVSRLRCVLGAAAWLASEQERKTPTVSEPLPKGRGAPWRCGSRWILHTKKRYGSSLHTNIRKMAGVSLLSGRVSIA